MHLLKIKALIILFISTTYAYNFKLCCPFAHQYNSSNETCFPSQESEKLKIYNLTDEVAEISGSVLNIINYNWCRNIDLMRDTEEITDLYNLQENGELYLSNVEEFIKSYSFCLSLNESGNNYIPIKCKFDEIKKYSTTFEPSTTIKTSTVKTNLPTTISLDTTPSNNEDCGCDIEPPKFPEIFCENLFNGTFEYCAKCTIENTCDKDECTTNLTIKFVDVLQDTTNKHIIQVSKKNCPYWQFTYDLYKNDTVHISILNQTCDENTNTKAAGILLYTGVAFVIIVVLSLLGIIWYLIRQKKENAAQYSSFVKEINTQETEVHPMYSRPITTYKIPENSSFK